MYPVPTSFDRKLEKCINLRWGLFLLFNPRIKFVYFRKWKIKLPFVTEIQVSWWTSLSPSFGLHLGWLWDKNKQKKSINNKWIVICADIDWRKLQKTLFIVHCISSHYYWENEWINDLFWSKKKNSPNATDHFPSSSCSGRQRSRSSSCWVDGDAWMHESAPTWPNCCAPGNQDRRTGALWSKPATSPLLHLLLPLRTNPPTLKKNGLGGYHSATADAGSCRRVDPSAQLNFVGMIVSAEHPHAERTDRAGTAGI